MIKLTSAILFALFPIISHAADSANIQKSVEACSKYVSDQRLNDAGQMVLMGVSSPVMIGLGLATSASPAVTTAGFMVFAGATQVSTHMPQLTTTMLNRADYPRLAYELASGQEGLVTESYLAACEDRSGGEDCKKSLEQLRESAQAGTMCSDWKVVPFGSDGYRHN